MSQDVDRRKAGPPQWVQVYTDGSCTNNGYENAQAGAGIWFGENDPRNKVLRVPEHLNQSNNAGEALAVLVAAKSVDTYDHVEILTDSKITIEGLTKSLEKHEDEGWIEVDNKEILRETALYLRSRIGQTVLTKVKGHSGLKGNDEADKLAKEGTETHTVPDTTVTAVKGHYTKGIRLSTASQANLYKGIIGSKPPPCVTKHDYQPGQNKMGASGDEQRPTDR